MIYKRGKHYWTDFSVDGTRYRKPLRTTSWQEAKENERDEIQLARSGQLDAKQDGPKKLFAAIDAYLTHKKIRCSERTLELEQEIEPLLTEMLVAWLAGNDEDLLNLIQQQSGDSELSLAFNKRLLDDRNVAMANTIERYLETAGTYFVLVGAAHFIGESGIVNLLHKRGITGQRVMSDQQI